MVTKPGEPTNLERNVTVRHTVRWAKRYEEDSRKLNELYEWFGIRPDTLITQVTGELGLIKLMSR